MGMGQNLSVPYDWVNNHIFTSYFGVGYQALDPPYPSFDPTKSACLMVQSSIYIPLAHEYPMNPHLYPMNIPLISHEFRFLYHLYPRYLLVI